jgi:hypothetical protein
MPLLAVPTDLVPTRSHLKASWVMAYDNEPAVSAGEKRALFDDLARVGGGLLLYHDPDAEAAWVTGCELVPGPLSAPTG